MPTKEKIEPVTEFTINRRTWLRGKGTLDRGSYLLNPVPNGPTKGKMCCLGFYLAACGISREELKGKAMPYMLINQTDLESRNEKLKLLRRKGAGWLLRKLKSHTASQPLMATNTKQTDKLVTTNDDTRAKNADIEKDVTRLFKEKGITVKFTG